MFCFVGAREDKWEVTKQDAAKINQKDKQKLAEHSVFFNCLILNQGLEIYRHDATVLGQNSIDFC